MLRDVFYYGKKPNAHPREKFAVNLADAKQQSTTEHFWIINEFCDYKGFDWDFDFEFLPDEDVWAENHNNVWPSNYQKDSGTWLCSTDVDAVTIYRADVDPIPRKNEISEYWKILEDIEVDKFDFKWHPDPSDPPYIYVFGNQWYSSIDMPTVEYHTPNATERKYVTDKIALLAANPELFVVNHQPKFFDYSWRPDPREPAYIYVWGNKYVPMEVEATVKYHTPGATDFKYMEELLDVLPEMNKWIITQEVADTFDMCWRPDPREPAYIYTWGNKYIPAEIKPTIEYVVEGATERKYMGNVDVVPNSNWIITQEVADTFDMCWRPDPREPAYIYTWGNKHVPAEIKPTIEYVVDGATERKYMGNVDVVPDQNWSILIPIDNSFDLTWRPDPREPAYIYVWGNKHIPGELKPTVMYTVPGATEYKYMSELVEVLPELDRWNIVQEPNNFDLTWRPDPREPAYIYVWGNKHIPGELKPTIEYHCPNATERKYVGNVDVKPEWNRWIETQPVDKTKFDMTWRPDPREPAYIYTWGNKYIPAEIQPTIEYIVPNATERKYMGDADVLPLSECWQIFQATENFDYSWRPDPREPDYIYVWGNKYIPAEIQPTIEYHVKGATERKYMGNVEVAPEWGKYKILVPVDKSGFDFSWRPDPREPAYIYVFGNKWNDATTEPTIEYHVEGATEYKYVTDIVATPKADMSFWNVSNQEDLETFDFTWRPNPHSPPQIYQWQDNGPRYTAPSATDVVLMERTAVNSVIINRYKIETTIEDLIKAHPNEVFWALNPNLNYDKFDFSWRPNEENFRHVNVFGNEYSKDTQTYYINAPLYLMGYKELNYVEDQIVDIDTNLSMFFIDRSNVESVERFNKLKEKYPKLQKTRYLNSWVDTINRCIGKSETNLFWILNSELDYTDFEFDFYPSPWQMKMVHVFGTQWSHWGNTYLINKESFPEDTKYVKIIEHLSMLNFVKSKRAKAVNKLYDTIIIDHGNLSDTDKVGNTVFAYDQSYIKTFKNILQTLPTKKEHYIWITSSVCDYTGFDFSYICDPYAKDQLHVFPSDKQKFGDTFLVDVNKLRDLIDGMVTLEDYEKVNYNQHQRVKRLPAPTIITESDTHVSSINSEFNWPYATFVTVDNKDIKVTDVEPMNLWDKNTKTIQVTSTGGTRIIVPKDAKSYIKRELYDYPYIARNDKLVQSKPLDIVFLSNGEKCADENYEHLLKVTKGLPNRVTRVDGVNGRVAAYHAAAQASETPWMFTVFAKLEVNKNFDWSWQPDRLQIAKHYIFEAVNPVNNLVYGHQAMIAYNKKLVLANTGKGLDFTLDDEHEVVHMNSGIAKYNTDAWSTWRTSFREALKLKTTVKNDPYDTTSIDRLIAWSTIGEGEFGQYSIDGALDAVEYYRSVNGDLDKLRLSYDWPWLRAYFDKKYNQNS